MDAVERVSLRGSLLERLLPYRRPFIVLVHALIGAGAFALAFLLAFQFAPSASAWDIFWKYLPILVVCRLVVFARFGLYQGLWRYVSMSDLPQILKSVGLGSLLLLGAMIATDGLSFPRTVWLLDWLLCLGGIVGSRVAVRALREAARSSGVDVGAEPVAPRRVIIVGAGEGAARLLRETRRGFLLNADVVALVDDDRRKLGMRLFGIGVRGSIADLPHLVERFQADEILMAIPSLVQGERRRIMQECVKAGVPVKTVPSARQLFEGRRIEQLEELAPEDLLGRKPVDVDVDRLHSEIRGRSILVTGAGGSIGSEMARQIAVLQPRVLILYERAESALYFVQLELKEMFPQLDVVAIVGDILDDIKLDEVMASYGPDVVYHAAAYKHVPLMESHPLDAIRNNVLGTVNVADAASRAGVKKFVNISTDKAVRPVGVMGQTKRVAESGLRSIASGPTTYVSVRFGNVLGSNGSVLPLFQKQIANGGPVTVTDPDAMRYFMLVAEAAQLVLQAGAMGKAGQVFFLDMGEPVKIVDLADKMIRLAGYAPGRDIEKTFTGLRAGERLTEELVLEQEVLDLSEHPRIFVTSNSGFSTEAFQRDLDALKQLVDMRDQKAACERLQEMASRY